jgi:D-cysteine desulfhydrase
LWYKQIVGSYPYFIPTGGSCPLGTIGFVDAAFELRDQIERGELPEPTYIYAALGSGGTVAGLAVGLKAAGLKSRVVAVTIEPKEKKLWYEKVVELARKTNELLCHADPTFPWTNICEHDFDLVTECAGERYAVPTPAGKQAKELLQATHAIELDTTYTAKTFAAIINDAKNRRLSPDTPLLFWHTYGVDSLPVDAQAIDYHELPVALQHYYQGP